MTTSAFSGWEAVRQLGPRTWLLQDEHGRHAVQQDAGPVPVAAQAEWPLAWTRAVHPRLVRIHEAVIDPRGHGMLRTSYIDGGAPTTPLREASLLDLTRAAAEVLAMLHRRSLCHGALRPDSFRAGLEGWVIVGPGAAHAGAAPWTPSGLAGPVHADLHALGLCLTVHLGGEVHGEGWRLPADCPPLWRELVQALTGATPSERLADTDELLQALENFSADQGDPLEELSDAQPLPSPALHLVETPPDPLGLFALPALPARASDLGAAAAIRRSPTPYLRSLSAGLGAAAVVLGVSAATGWLQATRPDPARDIQGVVVEVQVEDPDREALRLLLDEEEPALSLPGRYRFTDVAPGSYRLTVLLGSACGATCPGATCPEACTLLSRSLHIATDDGPIVKEHLLIDRRGPTPGLLRSR